ncbi:DUF3037 domain-containing protein [soil metagenome]
MPEQHVFESAVIRVVPMVEREEFLNVGVILYCKDEKFLRMKFELEENRLGALCRGLNIEELREHLNSFEQICEGGPVGGDIGKLSMPERFRWLTATRSTIIQCSKVHPGRCEDAGVMLERMFVQMVRC